MSGDAGFWRHVSGSLRVSFKFYTDLDIIIIIVVAAVDASCAVCLFHVKQNM